MQFRVFLKTEFPAPYSRYAALQDTFEKFNITAQDRSTKKESLIEVQDDDSIFDVKNKIAAACKIKLEPKLYGQDLMVSMDKNDLDL